MEPIFTDSPKANACPFGAIQAENKQSRIYPSTVEEPKLAIFYPTSKT
jgi:hypothetical protein